LLFAIGVQILPSRAAGCKIETPQIKGVITMTRQSVKMIVLACLIIALVVVPTVIALAGMAPGGS
jgi:hypothetical protein